MAMATRPKKTKPNLDWTRNPPPLHLTPFQKFIRDVDWKSSPLGPMDDWPDQLRQMVHVIVADPNPAVVYWGDSQAIVYNEAYVELIGQKHPGLQGQNPRTGGFAEIWDQFDAILLEGERTGKTHIGGNQLLLLFRHSYLEETYFSWKFIPMIGPEGVVVASYATVFENTREVINTRRSELIRNVVEAVSSVDDLPSLWSHFLLGFENNAKDLPIAMIYSNNNDSPDKADWTFVLEGSLGISAGHNLAPEKINLNGNQLFATAMRTAVRTGSFLIPLILRVADGTLPPALLDGITGWRGFGLAIKELAICPIRSGSEIIAFAVIGLNPHKLYDTDYDHFLRQLTQLVSPRLTSILLSEERERRALLAQEAAVERERLSSLLREELKFASFADRAPVGLCVTNLQGVILYANEAWYNFAGMSSLEVEEMKWMDSVVPEDKHILEEAWRHVIEEKSSWTFQVRSKQKWQGGCGASGAMKTTHFRTGLCAAYPDLDVETGDVTSIMGIIVDISELKWNEEQVRSRTRQLEESEIKYRQFAEHAPLGVARVSLDGKIEFANDAWLNIFDHSIDGSKPWMQKIYPEDLGKCKEFLSALHNRHGPLTIEHRLTKPWNGIGQTRSNQPTWLLASGYAETDANGAVQNIVCWVTEISAQKAAAKAISEKMEEAIIMKNRQENFIDMISHEIRNPLSAVLHCTEEIMDSMQSYNNYGQSSANLLLSGPNLKKDSSQALTSAMDAAQTILYCVEHQKRIVDDVLTLSKLDADLLEIMPIPVQPTRIIRQALKIFDRELRISDIKLCVQEDVSLQEQGLDWAMLDPNRFLQILINLITNAIKFTRGSEVRNIIVKISASASIPLEGMIKYFPCTKKVSKSVDLANEKKAEDLTYLSLAVCDTGKGLSDEERKVLFNRFAQASPKTHIEYGGSGLGLFISRQITEMMGGQIGINDQQSEGCTFAFFVKSRKLLDEEAKSAAALDKAKLAIKADSGLPPVERILEPGLDGGLGLSASSESSFLTKSEARKKAKILVVEDNLVNQRVLCKLLRNRGYEVVAANNGVEALAALQEATSPLLGSSGKRPFDIVLCDIEMPIMDGIECVRAIRRLEGQKVLKGHVPVVAVTANARSEHTQNALEAGMDDITIKPYRTHELISQIENIARRTTLCAK